MTNRANVLNLSGLRQKYLSRETLSLQVVVNLARSSNRVDKPYLLLRLGKLCWDSALMEYGPAVQASVGSVQLVDRLHPGSSGQYLEMISTAAGPDDDVLTLLYRKVQYFVDTPCPNAFM